MQHCIKFYSFFVGYFRGYAPANCREEPYEASEEGSPLGLVPHSIRGFLAHFQQVLPASHMFSCCIACSDRVWYALSVFKSVK
jgi:hypothetical protein